MTWRKLYHALDGFAKIHIIPKIDVNKNKFNFLVYMFHANMIEIQTLSTTNVQGGVQVRIQHMDMNNYITVS